MKKLIYICILVLCTPFCAQAAYTYGGFSSGGGGGVPSIRDIATTAPLNGGGDLSADRTLGIDLSGVTAGSYTNASFTVDQFGLLTLASSGVGFLMPASTDVGQIFVANAIGGGVWEPVTDLSYLTGQLSVTSTSGPQFKAAFDALNFATFETDSIGGFYINPTGVNVFIGNLSGASNTGASSNGFGYYSLRSNIGENSNGFGYYSLRFNSGANSNGFGNSSLRFNTGVSSNGFGNNSLRFNTGINSNGFGTRSLYSNIGANSNGFGYDSLRFNSGNSVSVIGHRAHSEFLPNTSGNKTFAFGDINITTGRVSVTSHGFGATSTWTNVLYTEGTSPITGLTNATVYQVWIADPDTVGFWEAGRQVGADITDAGSGTGHTLTPQFSYDDVVCIGNNSSPTGGRQIIFNGDHDDMIAQMTLDAESINITSNITPPALSAQVANWNPAGLLTCRRIRVSTTGGNVNVTGIVAIPYRELTISNVGTSGTVTLVKGSVASSAANQFLMFANVPIQPTESVKILYDQSGKWMVTSRGN